MSILMNHLNFFKEFKWRTTLFALSLILVFSIGVIFICYTWYSTMIQSTEKAYELILTAKAALETDKIAKLSADGNDAGTTEFKSVKEGLEEFVSAGKRINSSYLLIKKDSRVFVLADSQPEDSPDYLPPGYEFTEQESSGIKAFDSVGPSVELPISKRSGAWVSVLVPLRDDSGRIILLGVDYKKAVWEKDAAANTVNSGILVVCVLSLYVLLIAISEKNKILLADISRRREAELALSESERNKAILLGSLPGMAYRCKFDRDYTMLYVSEGCESLTGYKPEELINNNKISFNDIVHPDFRDELWSKWKQAAQENSVCQIEYQIIAADGKIKWVWEQGQGVYDEQGRLKSLEGLMLDVSDRKKREQEIIYLNYHDALTDTYNRRYFEEQRKLLDNDKNLPLSVIIGDINGLKLINDALGHIEGDRMLVEVAKILKESVRKEDIVARTGGDEFGILLPATDSEEAYGILNRIKKVCEEYERNKKKDLYFASISLGFATKSDPEESFENVIKIAEEFMYRRKLLEHKSMHSTILSSMKAAMIEKNRDTEKHAARMVELSRQLGRVRGLNDEELNELELLATLHDIGKIGVDNSIITKPEKLNEDEWSEMKKHPEIGYRIAMSTPDLMPIAESILYHHEHWDGMGYPEGLKGEQIPLLSRIISIVDAYDAMTKGRPYMKPFTQEKAVKEIRDNSGTQFDPEISRLFVEEVLKLKW